MRRIEDLLNRMSDMDWGWWPVLSLRPPKDGDIGNRLLFKLTLMYGSVTGLLALLVEIVVGRTTFSFKTVIAYLLIGCVVFFILYKSTFAYFWNRRARRMRGGAIQ